ncbi:MAG: exodeoxyribonuclease VII small subunit [Silvanigrellaceae bacterium]
MESKKAASYKDLQAELQRILGSLEQDSTSLDEIASLLKGGFETIDALRARLSESEAQIENIISLRHNTVGSLNEKNEGETR